MLLTAIPQPPLKVVSLEDAMVTLADEGVPVRAIARATHTPSEEVYDVLRDAVGDGKLIELPQNDWPPGSLRRSRQQSGQSPLNLDDFTLRLACAKLFKMTRLQAAVFVAILRRPEITKDQIHDAIESTRHPTADPTDQKMIDVVICHIRKKLKGQDFGLKTIWGQGYSMPRVDRDKALGLLTAYFQPQQAPDDITYS
jgi:DNA-binding response OmpR family regulator